MIVWLIHYITGYLTVEIQGTSKERFVNMCMHHKIRIWNLYSISDKYRFKISRKNFKKLKPFMKKTESKIRILERTGVPFLIFQYRKRTLFLAGAIICVSTICLFSQFIWNIDISGNQYYTEEAIMEFLNENEVEIMKLSREIDCDSIVSMLRGEFENITWASVHIDGCQLVIKIKENDQLDMDDLETVELQVSNTNETSGVDIIAQESGIITSLVTRSGTPLVHVGDEVSAGDILVTGCLELYNDSAEIIGYRYVESDADIYIETTIEYTNAIELQYMEKVYTEEEFIRRYLVFGNYYLIDSRAVNSDQNLEIQSTEFSLLSDQQQSKTLIWGYITYLEYEWNETIYSENDVRNILTTAFEVYCNELIEKDVQILENSVNIYVDEKYATARGTLDVIIENDKTSATEEREPIVVEVQEGNTE